MSNSSILDMPDEILVMIILHFDARERLALTNSCKKFNDLVFRDRELLRKLDFTGEQQLTRASDIQQYFNDENTCKKILRINIEHVSRVANLSSSIGKAINLVELNILHGLEFESVEELSCFLKPLVHLKRLSVTWPYIETSYDNPEQNQVLGEPLSRLTYLSLELSWYTHEFLLILQLCQQLEELRLLISSHVAHDTSPLRKEFIKLNSLKFVRLTGHLNLGTVGGHIMCIVPNPAEWTDLHLIGHLQKIYLERNVEVCAELSRVKGMPPPQYVERPRNNSLINEGWPIVYEHLLSEVIRITHEDAPEKFCCLSPSGYFPKRPCLLKIDEAKKLLKDPRYQITYLHFIHVIERNCDAHLLASTFPNLTELLLSQISNKNSMSVPENTKPLHRCRCLRKKGGLASEEEDSDAKNADSLIKMLVENTPRLKVLEISPDLRQNIDEHWDSDALYLISDWKNLTVIRFYDIPITDGKFLIDIGKECKNLEEVTLRNLSLIRYYSWDSELLQMLQHCKNLRKFLICQINVRNMSKIFDTLSNYPELRHVRLITRTESYDSIELVSSVEQMLRRCPRLTKLVFMVQSASKSVAEELEPGLQRVVSGLNRPNLEFHGPVLSVSSSAHADSSDSLFAHPPTEDPFLRFDVLYRL